MSISVEKALAVIDGLIEEHRATALSKPKEKSEYGFGWAVGVEQGLQMALQGIQAAMTKASREEEQDEQSSL